ncbi:TonB-dependent receptor [Alteromonas sp. 1_MG-2023]|uniref:TonB-dependent receptor n=1 Tax=Alteromonas sp. 1_MG-2023 TaxID=3062669 RepID=UPI0026E15FE7|nr:TonB-dependent receptor plug domain-containing protein [Alteromonas sp. 1_MG-2023]MDO6475281.1 TonB-dependent receptor [Alteromonas sp. 1_MG-2023]
MKRKLVLAMSGLISVPFQTVLAQEKSGDISDKSDKSLIEQITVTAQRKVESIQDVPMGISVISSDQLDRQQITTLSDLSKSSASLQFGGVGNSGNGGGGAYVRGIGTFSLSRSVEQAVGVVVDGVVQGNTNINNLFDISRVEVLRGPQGTLFGQSVSAGVINITTAAPDPFDFSAKVSSELSFDGVGGSEYGKKTIRGTVNMPVAEDAAVRISAYNSYADGIVENVWTAQKDTSSDRGVRARFFSYLDDSTTLSLAADYDEYVSKDGQFFTYTGAASEWATSALADCGVNAQPGNLTHCSDEKNEQSGTTYGLSMQLDIEFQNFNFTSITALRESERHATADIDRIPTAIMLNSPPPNINSGVLTDYSQFTQEFRLSSDSEDPLSYTIGAFFYSAETTADQNPEQGSKVVLSSDTSIATIYHQESGSLNYSVFGELEYQLGDLTLFSGARFNVSELDYQEQNSSVGLEPEYEIRNTLNSDYEWDDKATTGRLGFRYELDNSMIYASISRGYKNGALSPITNSGGVVILERVVRPEIPTAYEVGIKSTLFNGNLATNLNMFYQGIKDLQAQGLELASEDNPVPVTVQKNVSRAVSKGLETDIFGQLTDNLSVNFSALYNIAEYPDDFIDNDQVSLGGEQMAFAPRFSANLSGEYTYTLSNDKELFVSANVRYRDESRLSIDKKDHSLSVDKARTIAGFRIGVRQYDEWSIALFADNVTGERTPNVFNPVLFGNPSAYYSSQSLRQIGLQAEFSF